MIRNRRAFAILLTAFVFVSFMALRSCSQDSQLNHNQGITQLMTVEVEKPSRTVSILFIGNSYTFFNNMPGIIASIARGDAGNTVALNIKAVTKGGAQLKSLWKSGEARQVLKERQWDYVVLQEQSFWPFSKGSIRETTGYAMNWVSDIRAAGAAPVIFMNWPREPGSAWYNNTDYPFLRDADDSYAKFHDQTALLAKTLKADMVPIGDYWYFAVQSNPQLKLYESDGSHPSVEGSYLAALVLYNYFTGRSPEATTYRPWKISEEEARTIRKITAYKN